MPGGYAGNVLEVDLTARKITKKPLDMKEAQMFIGGRGLGSKWLYDRTKPGGSPLAADNPMFFMAGPLNGLPSPSTARLSIVTKSASTSPKSNPKTGGLLHTNCGGRFTPELKFAGYDAIIVTGAASSPVCLVIEDDKVELRPATKYWGMGNYKLQMTLDEDFGRRWRSVYIGPAGEHLVRYANVMTEIHRACGRGGSGAVMGSKKLKAIATARGGNQIVILRGEVLHKFDKEITRFGEVWPVRVKGHIKTKWIESATPQPAPAGWLLWLEVEKATIDLPSPEERKRDAKEWQ